MSNTKAFIFDLDGVLIDSDRLWDKEKPALFKKILGTEKAKKIIGKTKGHGLKTIYKWSVELGYQGSLEDFTKYFEKTANKIYTNAKIPQDINELISTLKKFDYKLGLVSSSPTRWIKIALQRIPSAKNFNYILSIKDTNIKPKPHPDSYLLAMNKLKVLPSNTVILEDTNVGIAAGKASGAFVIGFTQFWPKNYKDYQANLYVKSMREVINFVKSC